jgi:hypothetical protein
MENFNKQNLGTMRKELNEILAKYGMEQNVNFDIGNMRFSDAEVQIKITAKIKGKVTLSEMADQSNLAYMCDRYALQQTGRNGERMVTFDFRAPKFPVKYVKDGKKFKCSLEYAQVIFKTA